MQEKNSRASSRRSKNEMRSRRGKASGSGRTTRRLRFEGLEDRSLMAVLYTNVLADDIGNSVIGSANNSANVATSADGNIYVAFGGDQGIRVSRSVNRGQSFQPSVQLSNTNNVGDVEVAVSNDGTVYAAWVVSGTAYVSRSTNQGLTFSAPSVVSSGITGPAHVTANNDDVYVSTNAGGRVFSNHASGTGAWTTFTSVSYVYGDVLVDPATEQVFVVKDNPSLAVLKSSTGGTTFANVALAPGGSIYYSAWSESFGPSGRFAFVAGGSTGVDAFRGYRINLDNGTTTQLTMGTMSASVSQGRSLASDGLGNLVDLFVNSSGSIQYRVSQNFGNTFAGAVTVTNSTSANVAINSIYGDIVVASKVGGDIRISVFENELKTNLQLASNTGSILNEGATDPITSSELKVVDSSTPAANIVYTVVTGPAHGRLELTTNAGFAAPLFTQADIDAGRLQYVNNGTNFTSDFFTFSVSNGAGGFINNTNFNFTILDVNQPVTGAVTITGLTQENSVLSANTSTLVDPDGIGPISYQWQRSFDNFATFTNVGGNTPLYTLGDADVGGRLRVKAAFTDLEGNAEAVTSAPTAVVTNVNDSLTGTVAITGSPTENQTLTANTTALADGDGLGTFVYQWQRSLDNFATWSVVGGNTATYLLGDADVSTKLRVNVSYTDLKGTPEATTSSPTAAIANVNDPPGGAVLINGTVTENQTLTANTATLSDADGLGVLSYQWQRSTNNFTTFTVVGAASTYTLGDADVGSKIRLRVRYTDGYGTLETVNSAPTANVANVNDPPGGGVTLAGTAIENATLTAITSTITDADGLDTFIYQWQRSFDNFATFTNVGTGTSTYLLDDGDIGARLRVKVSYVDGKGTTETLFSPNSAIVANFNDPPDGDVDILGIAREDVTLTADTATLSDPDGLPAVLNYQWRRSDDNFATYAIVGINSPTYTLGDSDVGTQLRMVVSYIDLGGSSESVSSLDTAQVANVNDDPTGTPLIIGIRTENQTLSANTTSLADADGLGTFTYRWQRSTNNFATFTNVGANSTTYVLGDADVGTRLRLSVRYVDGQGTSESLLSVPTEEIANINDPPTGIPVVTGLVKEEQTLTADPSSLADVDGLGAFQYQWQRSFDGFINYLAVGSDSPNYTLTGSDVGATMRVVVSYTDNRGTFESVTSAATVPAANLNNPPLGAVVIDGDTIEDFTLTANTNTIVDDDGLGPFVYQWQRSTDNFTTFSVVGANSSGYTLGDADVGAKLRVRVSYTDLKGTAESLLSAVTPAVINVNDLPRGRVLIARNSGGTLLVSDTRTISDVEGLGTLIYTWQRSTDNFATFSVVGGNTPNYTLTPADTGTRLRLLVSYSDGQGTNESLTSNVVAMSATLNAPSLRIDDQTGLFATVETNELGDVPLIEVIDLDSPNDSFVYSLEPDATTDYEAFTVQPLSDSKAELVFQPGYGDYEKLRDKTLDNAYEVIVNVTDSTGLTATMVVTVVVTDLNETPAIITVNGDLIRSETYNPATDPLVIRSFDDDNDHTDDGIENDDAVLAQPPIYAIVPVEPRHPAAGPDFDSFTIDTATGVLSFVAGAGDFDKPADSDGDNIYVVTISVSDGALASETTLFITLQPGDDNNPVISTAATATVAENVPFVINVLATDSDITTGGGPAETISYLLPSGQGDNDFFNINSGTGEITFKPQGTSAGADYELRSDTYGNTADAALPGDNVYVLKVVASDGNATGFNPVQTVKVTLTPVNDNPPFFISSAIRTTEENRKATLDGDATTGRIDAGDADLPEQTLTYSIVSRTDNPLSVDAAKFDINPATGALIFLAAPDYEHPGDANQDNAYEVLIRVADSTGADQLTAEQLVTVNVTPANDPPRIISNGGGNSASINTPENTINVTTVEAADDEGAFVTYYIVGGDDQAKFSIGKSSGVLNFRAAPDFETKADANHDGIYSVVVEARDGAGGTDRHTILVTVTNSNAATTTVALVSGAITIRDVANVGNRFTWSRVGGNFLLVDNSGSDDSKIVVTGIPSAIVAADQRTLTLPVATVKATAKPLVLNTGVGDDIVTFDINNQTTKDDPFPDFGMNVVLGSDVDTLDLTNTQASFDWTFTGKQAGKVNHSIFGSFTFTDLEKAEGGGGVDSFHLDYTGANGIRSISGHTVSDPGTGSLLDAIYVSRAANFTLTDAKLIVDGASLDQTFSLANIRRAFLDGTGGNETFDISGWTSNGANSAISTYGGKLVGGGGNDTIVKKGSLTSFNLASDRFTTSDGMLMLHAQFEDARLERTGSGNTTFNASSWNHRATLTGTAGNDTLIQNSNFTSLSLGDTSLQVNAFPAITLSGIDNAQLINGSAASTVTLSNFGMGGTTTFSGGTGNDRVKVTQDGNFEITNNFLTASSYSVTLSGVEAFTATGGPTTNRFDISTWTGSGNIVGNGPTAAGSDLVIASATVNMTLAPGQLTIGSGAAARSIYLEGIEDASLWAGGGDQTITLSEWAYRASVSGGGGGGDRLVVARDRNATLDEGKVTIEGNNIAFKDFEYLTVRGSVGSRLYDLTPNYQLGLLGVQLEPGDGNDTVNISSSGDVSLLQTGTTSASLSIGSNVPLTFGTGQIPEIVNIDSTAPGRLFTFTNYKGTTRITGSGTGNRLVATNNETGAANPNFSLTSNKLVIATRTFTLAAIQNVTLNGSAGNNAYTVNGWTNDLVINAAGGNDSLTVTSDAASISTGATSLLLDAQTITPNDIDNLKVVGGNSPQTFNVAGWTRGGTLVGGGGNDRVVLTGDTDMRLVTTSLSYGPTGSLTKWQMSSIESAELSGGPGKNILNATSYAGTTTLSGLGGDDILLGGNGPDTLIGGTGNDWLSGNAGSDLLQGGDQSDILVGGDGIDIVGDNTSDNGDDIIIGGRTSYDGNPTAIRAIIDFWAAKTNFQNGVQQLKQGISVPGGATYRLNATTVFDDDLTDTLYGGNGLDWFFAEVDPAGAIGFENPDDTLPSEPGAVFDL